MVKFMKIGKTIDTGDVLIRGCVSHGPGRMDGGGRGAFS